MIETPRLVLRPLRAEDLAAFVAYRREPGVARYQEWEPTFSVADAEALLAAQADLELGRAMLRGYVLTRRTPG